MRRLAIVGVLLTWWLAIAWHWVPYVDYDTQIFEQVAQRPFGAELLVQAKPLVVPLIYRAAGSDHQAIAIVQAALSLIAWTALGLALVSALQRRSARVVAVIVVAEFALAPTRMGFTASLMTESIDDSLMALLAAAVICVLQRRRFAVPAAIAVALIWLFTRDTNAAVAIVASASAALLWRRRIVLLAIIVSAFAMWTATQPHPLLPYQDNWYPRFSPRTAYPLVDNVAMRVAPPVMATFDRAWDGREVSIEQIVRGDRRDVQDWIVDDGLATYAGWWIRHPFARLAELVDWRVLDGSLAHYMPAGWSRGGFLRRLTTNHVILIALLLTSPWLLRRPRRHPLRGLALVMLGSGLVGLIVAYYGDAAEITRHVYGSGQQIALALFVALLAWLDVVEKPRSMR